MSTPSEINTHAMVATGIVELLTKFYMINDDMYEYCNLAFMNNNIFATERDCGKLKLKCKKTGEMYKILSTYSLIELRNFLCLLIPLVSCSSKDASSIRNLKSAIKFIEKDLYSMTDDQRNGFDLIKINQELKNENALLKKDLEEIKKIFSK